MTNLVALAETAVAAHPKSAIEIALAFLKETLPSYCGESNDRLVKIGRNLVSLIALKKKNDPSSVVEAGLNLLLEECRHVLETDMTVPRVRFGKTEIQMPIITVGCMRFQQQWGRVIDCMDQVYSDCQQNLVDLLRTAIGKYGINHIETAWGYGSSQLQLGVALQQLILSGEVKREDLIIQTKVGPRQDPKEFREQLDECFHRLKVDYVDLFAFHGLNGDWQMDWMFGNNGNNCWNVIQEYKAAGKIGHVGFSTHGPSDFIYNLIETGKFDYVNLHHHFCGSYTASGDGPDKSGNARCVRLANKLDMGVSIISVLDKGGKIYEPSRKLRSLCLPDVEPMTHGLGWLWNLDVFDEEKACAHTVQVGFARAVDLDQIVVPAYLQGKGELLPRIQASHSRLMQAQVDALGEDWLKTCYEGILKSHKSKYLIEYTQCIWLYNCMMAWGMHKFAKDRYKMLAQNTAAYDPALPDEEAIDKIGRIGWGFCPGLAPDPEKDYFADELAGVPEQNRARVVEAFAVLRKWCSPDAPKKDAGDAAKPEEPPEEWQTAFDLKPWKDFPDRPYP